LKGRSLLDPYGLVARRRKNIEERWWERTEKKKKDVEKKWEGKREGKKEKSRAKSIKMKF
jgi:hypothetical protein